MTKVSKTTCVKNFIEFDNRWQCYLYSVSEDLYQIIKALSSIEKELEVQLFRFICLIEENKQLKKEKKYFFNSAPLKASRNCVQQGLIGRMKAQNHNC